MMIASANAANVCVIGVVSAAETLMRMMKPRSTCALLAEAPRLVVLAAEHLDHLVAVDGFLQHVHQVALRALRLARHAAQALRDHAHRERDRRPDHSAISVSFQLR